MALCVMCIKKFWASAALFMSAKEKRLFLMISAYSVAKPVLNGKSPSGRGGTSACFADNKLVVFGGHFYVGDSKFEYCDETWLLDIENRKWHKMVCTGDIPAARYGHSACILGSRMFVFGGRGEKGVLYRDMYFLDLVEWVWVKVNPLSEGPCARMNHAAELVGRRIVVHGGWDGYSAFNDIWLFNTDSFTWMQPKTSGFGPTPRFGHTITYSDTGCLILFGGCCLAKDSGVPNYLNDVRKLDTETMVWTRPRLEGAVPTARFGHSALMYNGTQMVVCGGWGALGCQSNEIINNPNAHSMQVLDTTSMTWSVPSRMGKRSLKHVYQHGACIDGQTLYMHGGFDGRQASYEYFEIALHPDSIREDV